VVRVLQESPRTRGTEIHRTQSIQGNGTCRFLRDGSCTRLAPAKGEKSSWDSAGPPASRGANQKLVGGRNVLGPNTAAAATQGGKNQSGNTISFFRNGVSPFRQEGAKGDWDPAIRLNWHSGVRTSGLNGSIGGKAPVLAEE
jgi:hypothetical protein